MRQRREGVDHILGCPALRLAHLWAIVLLASSWFTQSTGTIEPYDFWWTVKSGEIMVQKTIETNSFYFLGTDVLVWTPVRLPYSNPQWGSQLIFYWLYSASPYLLLTARTLIVTATLGIILWLCFWGSRSWRAASLAALMAYLTAWTNYGIRPQLLAFLPFITFVFLLERKDAYPRWLPLLTPIMLFWVNVHGSFVLGVALLAIYAVGTVLERLGSADGRRWLASRAAAWQFLCFAAAILATLANPYLAFIYKYLFIVANDPIVRAFNLEFQGTTIYVGTGIIFFSHLCIFAASVYFGRRKIRPTEVMLVLAFGYLALSAVRYVIWWGWVTAPMLAANFSAIDANRAMRRAEAARARQADSASTEQGRATPSQPAEIPALNWLIAVILVGGAVLFTPLWRPTNPFVSANASSALADNTPVKLTAFLKESHPPAPLFNYMEWGGYLEWELYPSYTMFVDGRFEARTFDVWKDYLAISGARADWQEILDRYGVNTLALNKDFHADLIRFVQSSPRWHKVYEDKMGVVFAREMGSRG